MLERRPFSGFFFNNNYIGNCSLSPVAECVILLNSLQVQEQYRNKGYATEIVKYLENEAKERKYHLIQSYVYTNNVASNRVFEKLGWKKIQISDRVNFYFKELNK